MDVYHKVLVKMYEASGGKESEDIDLAALLKREGFFSNFESIKSRLSSESWITETKRDEVVRLTHWGIQEARKSGNDSKNGDDRRRSANRLHAESKDFAKAAEEFSNDPSAENFSALESNLGRIQTLMTDLRSTG